jgi:hypothetical protein
MPLSPLAFGCFPIISPSPPCPKIDLWPGPPKRRRKICGNGGRPLEPVRRQRPGGSKGLRPSRGQTVRFGHSSPSSHAHPTATGTLLPLLIATQGEVSQLGGLVSVGLAIFLGSVVLTLVMLYGITKDRWRWRRIAKLCALILVTPVALVGVFIAGWYVWGRLPAATYPQTEYAGLRLGIGPDEVIYIKGYPPEVLGPPDKGYEWAGQTVIYTENLEKGERVEDYKNWSYDDSFKRIEVTFNTEKTAVVDILCYSSDSQRRCPPIFGVADGDSEQDVIRKLGPPGTSRIEGVTKHISYPAVGIDLWLGKERVYMLSIYNRKLSINDRRYTSAD